MTWVWMTDQELWEEDPHEFVRKTYDIMEDYTSERVAACNLVIDLCKVRTKTTLVPTLEMCVAHMKSFAEGTGNAAGRCLLLGFCPPPRPSLLLD